MVRGGDNILGKIDSRRQDVIMKLRKKYMKCEPNSILSGDVCLTGSRRENLKSYPAQGRVKW